MLRALIWDVDGTVAETERDGHRVAFNRAFAEAGLPWHWDVAEYAELLEVTGGRERILAYLQRRADAPAGAAEREALARRLHPRKNAVYAELVAQGGIAARPGVLRLMDECHAEGVALAIATTTSRANVEALFASLLGGDWRGALCRRGLRRRRAGQEAAPAGLPAGAAASGRGCRTRPSRWRIRPTA